MPRENVDEEWSELMNEAPIPKDLEQICAAVDCIFDQRFDQSFNLVGWRVSEKLTKHYSGHKNAVLIVKLIEKLMADVYRVCMFAPFFDYSTEVPGNGYWSITKSFLRVLQGLQQEIRLKHVLSMKPVYSSNLFQNFLEMFTLYEFIFEICKDIFQNKEGMSLFSPFHLQKSRIEDIKNRNIASFYGSWFGLYYTDSIRKVMDMILSANAAFGKGFDATDHKAIEGTYTGNITRDILSGLIFPSAAIKKQLRGKELNTLFHNANVRFAQYFWNQPENLTSSFAKYIAPIAAVNVRLKLKTTAFEFSGQNITPPKYKETITFRIISYLPLDGLPIANVLNKKSVLTGRSAIPFRDEDLVAPKEKKKMGMKSIPLHTGIGSLLKKTSLAEEATLVPAPACHEDYQNCIQERYESFAEQTSAHSSFTETTDSIDNCDSRAVPEIFRSGKNYNGILVHFHGGGFLGQTSRSHQIYLRKWAKRFKLVIVSVDYTLSPDGRYPISTEECFYMYCWVSKNKRAFGVTEDAPIFVSGDSAGGCLTLTTSIMAVQRNVKPPTAIHCNYPAANIKMDLSPARCLAAMDGLLNIHVLILCLESFCPLKGDNDEVNDRESPPSDCSPWHASDTVLAALPDIYLTGCELDPLLDDSVDLARRLKKLNLHKERKNKTNFKLCYDSPHGYLNFMGVSDPAVDGAIDICTKNLEDILTENLVVAKT